MKGTENLGPEGVGKRGAGNEAAVAGGGITVVIALADTDHDEKVVVGVLIAAVAAPAAELQRITSGSILP